MNLWHSCHGGLFVIIKLSKRFTITALDCLYQKLVILDDVLLQLTLLVLSHGLLGSLVS